MSAARLAAYLAARGFRVQLWRDQRVYVRGYGKDVTCYIEPAAEASVSADGANISVSSNWRSPHVGLRCKGIKHALLCDLYALGLLSVAPPPDWRQVRLDDRPAATRIVPTLEPDFGWPTLTRSDR